MKTASFEQGSTSPQITKLPPPDSTWHLLWRAFLATILAWFVSQMLNSVVIGERLIPRPPITGVGSTTYLLLVFVSSLIVTIALAYVAKLSSLRGIALVQALVIAHFGLNHLLTLVEATVFLPTLTAREVGLSIFAGAIQSMILAICIVAALGKFAPTSDLDASTVLAEPMNTWEWLWKFAVCAIAYVVLYVIAGLLILPYVREYYPELVESEMDPLFLIGLQVRRGIIYVACLAPLIRSLQATRIKIAFAIATLVPVVHGVAGLMVPSEHMGPTAWRLAHMLEIGWSNFVFGMLIGYLFSRGAVKRPAGSSKIA